MDVNQTMINRILNRTKNTLDCGYGYKVVCCYQNKYSKPVQINRGENAVYKFMENMLEEVKWCQKMNEKYFKKPIILTKEDQQYFKTANECHICNKKYSEKRYPC